MFNLRDLNLVRSMYHSKVTVQCILSQMFTEPDFDNPIYFCFSQASGSQEPQFSGDHELVPGDVPHPAVSLPVPRPDRPTRSVEVLPWQYHNNTISS